MHRNITRLSLAAGLGVAAITPLATAEEEHMDVWLQNLGSTIGIGGVSEDGTEFFEGVRVFGAEFGEDPVEPFFADEPGLQAFEDFDPFQQVQVNFVDAVTRWNGDGYSDTAETVTLSFGPNSLTSGDGFVSGLPFSMDAEGGFHTHFDILLNGDGGNPGDGIYLLPLQAEFLGSGPMSPSETFWFVMNLNGSEADHEAAIEWVEQNLVPAPGAAILLALVGIGRGRRRR
jgi:hypothetical protein